MTAQIERRLEALEALSGRTVKTMANKQDAAWSRLFAALRQGVRAVLPTESTSSYEAQIAALDERLKSGSVTPGDLAALAHLNHGDLLAVNTTAAEIVDLVAEVDRAY